MQTRKDLSVLREAALLLLGEHQLTVAQHVELARFAANRLGVDPVRVQLGHETRGPLVIPRSGRAVVDLYGQDRQRSAAMDYAPGSNSRTSKTLASGISRTMVRTSSAVAGVSVRRRSAASTARSRPERTRRSSLSFEIRCSRANRASDSRLAKASRSSSRDTPSSQAAPSTAERTICSATSGIGHGARRSRFAQGSAALDGA